MRLGSDRKGTWEAEKSVSDAGKPERAWTLYFCGFSPLRSVLMTHIGAK